ncbi:MAG TPA: hypothetical protein VFI37_04350 [Gaiellaceae bacterium]|jgi:hypothetical protein|nr:hypothetical protein [Gaiellaceae bacterium]
MDSIGGARILTERFRAGSFGPPELEPPAAIEAVDALPLFHWTGVEPTVGTPAAPIVETGPPHRRRLRGRKR